MRTALGLAALTGLAWTAAHPPAGVWWLAFLVVPGWLAAVERVADRRARDAFLIGLLIGMVTFVPMLWWLVAPATLLAPLLLGLVMGTWVGLASIAVQPWVRRPMAAVLGPVVFAGIEVLRARWPLGGFGWGDLATAHADGSWMLSSARVLGADGLTVLTALLGGLAWGTVRGAVRAWPRTERADEAALAPGVARVVRAFDAVQPLALATLAVAVLGTLVTVGQPQQTGQAAVLVVQGSDGRARASGVEEDLRILESHVAETRRAVDAGGVPDLVVWAESAVNTDPSSQRGQPLLAPLAAAGRLTDGRLITGVDVDGPDPSETFRRQIARVREDGSLGQAYTKVNTVPFGEYVPFRAVLGSFPPLRQVPRDAIVGDGPVTIDVDGLDVAGIICFETLFPALAQAAVTEDDADLLVVVTNNASFGRTAASAQHVAESQLRAVETGRSVVHAAISGVSALITPDGRVVRRGPLFEVASVRATLPVLSGRTPAATVGPVVSAVLGASFLAALGVRLGGAALDRRRRVQEPT